MLILRKWFSNNILTFFLSIFHNLLFLFFLEITLMRHDSLLWIQMYIVWNSILNLNFNLIIIKLFIILLIQMIYLIIIINILILISMLNYAIIMINLINLAYIMIILCLLTILIVGWVTYIPHSPFGFKLCSDSNYFLLYIFAFEIDLNNLRNLLRI